MGVLCHTPQYRKRKHTFMDEILSKTSTTHAHDEKNSTLFFFLWDQDIRGFPGISEKIDQIKATPEICSQGKARILYRAVILWFFRDTTKGKTRL